MIKKILLLKLVFTMAFGFSDAQSMAPLRLDIHKILEDKSATVGVAIWGSHQQDDTISVNGHYRLPMQSVYKFHLALYVMHQIDQGKLSLDDQITIDKQLTKTYSHLWSPLRKQYPDGAKISLEEVITSTVAWSDNLGCDILFDLVGGPSAVQAFLHKVGVTELAIRHPEIQLQADWSHQYQNWTTARAANQALRIFYENTNELLSPESHSFLLNVLKGTQTGLKDIRGGVPEEAVVAHKTGYSGQNDEGLIAALNNIGIVFLPDGSHFYISVLVSDSSEGVEGSHKIIAEIAKAAWDHYQS